MKPRIAITMGDPAGIGPEIVLKAMSHSDLRHYGRPVIVGDAQYLMTLPYSAVGMSFRKKFYLRPLSFREFLGGPLPHERPHDILVVDIHNISRKKIKFGVVSSFAGKVSGDYIKGAADGLLAHKLDGLVTAPINKVSFRRGGWGKKFIGHSEMLAHLTGTKTVCSMMMCGNLRSVPVTSHVPLERVSQSIRKKKIVQTILTVHAFLRKKNGQNPKIAVSGLNPHAGDQGLLGNEEQRQILPAIATCFKRGVDVVGPLSPDIIWSLVYHGVYDVGVAMYHDQGQIPVKLMGFKFSKSGQVLKTKSIAVTLGLPFIRTSVCHGSAYDIAGKGIASEGSLVEAFKCAAEMANRP